MKYSINLASRSYVNKRALYLGYALCGTLLFAGLLLNGGYFLKLKDQIRTTATRLTELEEKLLASQGDDVASYSAARHKEVLAEIESANNILKRDTFRWTALLDQLEKVVPGNVNINKIEPDHNKRLVKIEGMAKRLADMKRFLDNLIKSKDYTDVLLLNQASVDVEGGNPQIRFSIELMGAF